ncbi:MAG: hypothetical protein ACOYZ7_02630 [Chloroflexota bacterium]
MRELSISDGFKFGCGFFLAAFIAWIVMAIIAVLLSVVFGAAWGGGILRELRNWSGLLPLLTLI